MKTGFRLALAVVATLIALAPRRALAQETPPQLEVVARSGVSSLHGSVAVPAWNGNDECPCGGGTIGLDSSAPMVPIAIEVGPRFRRLYVAGFLQVAPVPSGSGTAFDVMMGATVEAHPFGLFWVDPWVGLGMGFEVMPVPGASSFLGLFGDVRAGVDFRVDEHLAAGPYVMASGSGLIGEAGSDPWAFFTTGSDTMITVGGRVVADMWRMK